MKKLTTSWMTLLLLIAIPCLCWGQSLIVHDGTAGIEADVVANLTSHLTSAGVTPVTTNVGVPGGSLSGYSQIWDVRFNNTTPLSASDMTAYTTYLASGGLLFLTGENTGFATRNNSIVSFITGIGGGTLNVMTPSNTQTVLAPYTGPIPITTVTFLASAGANSPPGNGALITRDASDIGAAIVFTRGTLASVPTGALIVVFDINFLQAAADAASQALTDNLIRNGGAAPVSVFTPVPTLSQWGMILLAVVMVGLGALMLRRRHLLQS